MGGSVQQLGKSGLTWDHNLSRLLGELQKTQETGAVLRNFTGAIPSMGRWYVLSFMYVFIIN
jgi:hypothetical protein